MAYLYCWNRPNIACSGGGAIIWDASGEAPWEIPYYDYQFNLPPAEGDMRDMLWPNGIAVRCLSPLQRYALRYEKPDVLEIEIEFAGVMDAVLTGGHIDQVGRVTGHMDLGGERSQIDCYAMRDRHGGRAVTSRAWARASGIATGRFRPTRASCSSPISMTSATT